MIDDCELKKLNIEAALLAKELGLEDRIDVMAKNIAFFTVKDQKSDFPAKTQFRLITLQKLKWGR